MTLSEFHDLVSTSLRRGTSLDGVIPSYSKLAATWMERNYDFKYMEVFRLLQLVSGDRTVNLPSNRIIKGIDFIRLVNPDEECGYVYLKKGNPKDFKGTRTEAPSGYWVSGINTIVFNNTPDEDLSGEAIFLEYTDWPTAPTGRHPLIDIGTDVMLYQTLIHMAAYLRDADMVGAYKGLRDESLNTLLRAEDETRLKGETLAMAYQPYHTQ
jgi:hypothetical protein